jgi:hypothetical protein
MRAARFCPPVGLGRGRRRRCSSGARPPREASSDARITKRVGSDPPARIRRIGELPGGPPRPCPPPSCAGGRRARGGPGHPRRSLPRCDRPERSRGRPPPRAHERALLAPRQVWRRAQARAAPPRARRLPHSEASNRASGKRPHRLRSRDPQIGSARGIPSTSRAGEAAPWTNPPLHRGRGHRRTLDATRGRSVGGASRAQFQSCHIPSGPQPLTRRARDVRPRRGASTGAASSSWSAPARRGRPLEIAVCGDEHVQRHVPPALRRRHAAEAAGVRENHLEDDGRILDRARVVAPWHSRVLLGPGRALRALRPSHGRGCYVPPGQTPVDRPQNPRPRTKRNANQRQSPSGCSNTWDVRPNEPLRPLIGVPGQQ